MHLSDDRLPLSPAVAWSTLAASAVIGSDAARMLASAETCAVTPSGPIVGFAMSQGEERSC